MSGTVEVLPGRLAATMGGGGYYIVLKCSCSAVIAAANRSGVSPKTSTFGLFAVQVSMIDSAWHSVVKISSFVLLSIFSLSFLGVVLPPCLFGFGGFGLSLDCVKDWLFALLAVVVKYCRE